MSVFILEYALSRTHVLQPDQSLPPLMRPQSVSLLLDQKTKQEALQEMSATELAEVFARVLSVKDVR